MSDKRAVLCILTEEQRADYQAELDKLGGSGVELVFEEDGEQALDQAGTLDPALVIVGMEVGPMEGLEFLALFMKRYPTHSRPIVVLPQKGDPFPPVAHRRDPATGRSEADEVTFDQIIQLAGGQVAPPPAAQAAPPVPAATTPEPTGTAPPAATGNRPGWLLPVIGLVVVAAIGGGGYLVLGSSNEQPADSVTDKSSPAPEPGEQAIKPDPPAKVADPAPPPPAAASESKVDESTAAATPSPAPDAPARPALDLTRETVLPLSFTKAGAQPTLTDNARLDALASALRKSATGRIEVTGHTCNAGDEAYNLSLGRRRAEAAGELLVKRGVPKRRLVLRSLGGTAPLASNATEEGRRKNRRVTIRVRP